MDTGQVNRNIRQYKKDEIIYEGHIKATQIGLVVKGRVLAEGAGIKDTLYSGSFIGIPDVVAGNYLCTYKALEDTIVCLFDANTLEELYHNITDNKDYCGLVIASLSKQIGNLYNNYEELYNGVLSAYQNVMNYAKQYEELAYKSKLERDNITRVFGLEPPAKPIIREQIQLYLEINTFTLDSVRAFFSQGNVLVKYNMKEISILYKELAEINQKLVEYMSMILDICVNPSPESVFYKYSDLALLMSKRGKPSQEIVMEIDKIINATNEYQRIIETTSSRRLHINRAKIDETYMQIISGSVDDIAYEDSVEALSEEEVKAQMEGALDIILNYNQIPFENITEFKEDIKLFAALKDKLSIDDDCRALRRRIADRFYSIYERVFIKATKDLVQPLPIQLFLKFGLIDERLITQEQLMQLYRISLLREGGKFNVYTMYEWLCLVYEGKREPSKNEFDQDYSEWLRAELVAKRIDQKEYAKRENDQMLKLHFEIHNFFRYVNRIANGKITTFIPILHKDSFLTSIDRLYIGAHKIETALQRVMDIDFSLFYREVGYVNIAKKIEKEYIMKEVLPEFIMAPTSGSNGVMWQTISEKKKDTPARFVLPQFLETNLNDTILKICAKFRWEMCRTVQGNTWNNLKYKSLTSEYVDYIQFYRKNHELSEERKEKIKAQVIKCSNRVGDVFALDYEAWIKGESQGAVRLNKVARRILARYCPFEKSIRARVSVQPLFVEPYQAYELERQKKAREISNHYKSLQNNQIELTNELIASLEFYQNM